MFGRAAITLGIGPHSSCYCKSQVNLCRLESGDDVLQFVRFTVSVL